MRRLIRDNEPKKGISMHTSWRRSLKGGVQNRTVACRRASEYLAACALEEPASIPLPAQLIPVIAELRKTAKNIRVRASERLQAIERLLRVEGYSFTPRKYDPLDQLLDKFYGGTPEKPETTTAQRIRSSARIAALNSVRTALSKDIASGRVRTLRDAVKHLRLLEHPPTAPVPEVSLAETHKDTIDAALALFRN